MARQRFIWPTIWSDPHVAHLPPDAMLLFIGCFSNADDVGRLLADPAYLKGTIFPYQRFDVSYVAELRQIMIERCPSVELYAVDGIEYLAFRRWKDHQKPKYPKPSKLPAPPKRQRRKVALANELSGGNDSGNDSVETEKRFPQNAETIPPQGWDGLGRDEKEPSSPSTEAKEPGPDDDVPLPDHWSTSLDLPLLGQAATGGRRDR